VDDIPIDPLRVVAGLLQDAEGRVLLAARPAGKAFAGRWEFPGGKIDRGEEPVTALVRELAEELGIEVDPADCAFFQLARHRYPNADRGVHIMAYKVAQFRGRPTGREGQALAWRPIQSLPDVDILEADRPIVTALRLGRRLTLDGSTPNVKIVQNISEIQPATSAHEMVAAPIADVSEAPRAYRSGADVLILQFAPSLEESDQLIELGLPWYVPASLPNDRATGLWLGDYCNVANSIST
jgi:8-oxo-dGTP diphosphatase